MIICKKTLKPTTSFPELNDETIITIKIQNKSGSAYLVAAYISPENKQLHQNKLIDVITHIKDKLLPVINIEKSRLDIPIVIYTDAN